MKFVRGACLAILLSSMPVYASTYIALGDSITSGTNAESGAKGQEYSWAVGSKLERTFAKALGSRIERAYALSIPGAVSPVLKAQTLLAAKLKPSYVTIEIGGNDFAWGVGHQVTGDLRWVLTHLTAVEPAPKIFLGTVPDLEQIYQLGQGRWPCRITHWLAPFFLKASDQRRQEVRDQIRTTNQDIADLAAEFSNVTLVPALSEESLDVEDISSVDCIHPSARGQQRIADAFIRALNLSTATEDASR